jgi:hypothetical protein
MFSLPRLRPYFWIGISLALSALFVNVALQCLASTPVLGWLPKIVAGTGFLEDSRQRVEAAIQEYKEGKIDANDYLCAFVGISNVREGIDLRVIAERSGVHCRYLGLAGAGLAIPGAAQQAEVLLTSELRPDLVIVGIGPHQMLDTKPKPGSQELGALGYLRRIDLRNMAIVMRGWIWVFSRRLDISLALDDAILNMRASLFRALHVQLKQPDGGLRDPWRGMIKAMGRDHYSEATLREELQFFESLGAFDPETYAAAKKAPATLVRVVKQFRNRGATVVVLLMPEHSRLRGRMPENITRFVKTPLRDAFPDAPPPVLDLRDAVDDEGFVDMAHLNAKGSAQCSRLLAAEIRHFLPHHPPLMNVQR